MDGNLSPKPGPLLDWWLISTDGAADKRREWLMSKTPQRGVNALKMQSEPGRHAFTDDHIKPDAETALWRGVVQQMFFDVFDQTDPPNARIVWKKPSMPVDITAKADAIVWFENSNPKDRRLVCEMAGFTDEYVVRKYREFCVMADQQ